MRYLKLLTVDIKKKWRIKFKKWDHGLSLVFLTVYQHFMGNLKPKFFFISKCLIIIITIYRFAYVDFFNSISTPYGLFNTKIWFISKCLIVIITIYMFHWIDLFNAWIKHQFLSGIRDSRKAASLWGMMRGVGRVRKSIHHSWLAKRLGLGLLCWGFKGVQEEIPREEAITFQIGSVAFPPGQCTSPQLHPCHRLFHQDGHQDISLPSL